MSETVKTQIPIYVYLHFHWDREWFLTASTARALLLDRVRKTLTALESGELPSFYLDGQAVVLEDLIEIEPEFAPRIKSAMSLGKLSAGPWYVLPDQSLVGGESLVRNLKLGIEITKRFGNPTMTGYNPDTFCHVQDLPRILQGMGISTAIVLRGVPPLSGTNVFWWDSPDGSRVLTYLLNKGLTHQVFHKTADGQEIAKDLMARWDLGSADDTTAPMLYSAGGEGMQPPGDLTNKLASVNANLPKNCQAKVVSIDEFLASFERWADDKALPQIAGELRDNRSINERFPAYILDGVSSTRLYLKRDNALSEHRLVRVIEPFFAMLHAQGIMTYPEGELRHAWKLLIQNHPHDSICGCSIDIVHQEMKTRTQQLNTFLDGLEMLAAEKIAEQASKSNNPGGKLNSALPVTTGLQPIDPDNGYDRLLIQNTSGYAYRAPVKMTWYTDAEKPLSLPSVQVQLESESDCPNLLFHSGGGFYYKKVRRFDGWLWPESAVPALGSIESEWISHGGIGKAVPESASVGAQIPDVMNAQSAQSSEIDNGLLKAKVDSAGNLVVISTNGLTKKEVTLVHDLCDVGDGGDSYNFDPLLNDAEIVAKFVSVKEGKKGPLLSSLLLSYTIDIPEGLNTTTVSEDDLGKGRSKKLVKHMIQTEVTLKKGVPILFFNTTFENRSADHRLSVRLHTGAQVKESWSECHFSMARRETPASRPELPVPVGHEVLPESFFCQRFFISQGQVFFNLGLPEYRTAGDYAEITLLRSVSWLSRGRLRTRGGGAGPWDATPEANCFGANRCEYAWAFLGEAREGQLADEQIILSYKLADLFEGRLVAHAIGNFTEAHKQSLITIANPAIYLAATYLDRGRLFLRLLNVTSTPQKTALDFTLPALSVAKVDLSGENATNLTVSKNADGLTSLHLNFGQNELATIALNLSTVLALFLFQFLFSVMLPCTAATTGVVVSGHTAFNPGRSSATVQDNLENAIAASQVRGPSAVCVINVNGKSVITYGGFYVCEVTPQMALTAKTTPQLLAQKWAGGLKAALAAGPKSPSTTAIGGNANKPALAGGKGYPKKIAPGNKPIANNAGHPYPQSPGLVQQAKIVYIPAGMTIPIVLSRPLSSMNARNGDPIEAVVSQDINLGNAVIPRNAGVLGVVTEAEAGGRMAHAGRLGLKFNRLVMPDGSQTPIQAHIVGGIEKYDEVGPPDSDVYKGERSSGSIKNAAIAGGIGAGAGAVAGTAIGAIAGGRYGVGRGAIAGLALGSGLGVAESVMLRRFKDVNVDSGQQLRLQMDSAARLALPPIPSY